MGAPTGYDLWLLVSNDKYRWIILEAESASELADLCHVAESTVRLSAMRSEDSVYEHVHYEEKLEPQYLWPYLPLPKGFDKLKPSFVDESDPHEVFLRAKRAAMKSRYWRNPAARRQESLKYYYDKKKGREVE